MKTEIFAELAGAIKEVLEHAQGQRDLRTSTLPRPPAPLDGRAVKRVRAALRASQAVFAGYLNVSTKLVQAWEGNRRVPEGPALVLLHIASAKPEFLEAIRRKPQTRQKHATTVPRTRQRTSSPSTAHSETT